MNIETERKRLEQTENLNNFRRNLRPTEMLTVYFSDYTDSHNHGIFCALIPSGMVETALSHSTWDLSHGAGMPGTITDNNYDTTYSRYCNDTGMEPLIIDRDFFMPKYAPNYKEISEEFRLFHNLYHDKKEDKHYKFDDAGNKSLIITVEPNHIKISLKEIRQFLAIKEMHLSIQFDFVEFSKLTLKELGMSETSNDETHDDICWFYGLRKELSIEGRNSFSRLLGKNLVEPLPKEKSGFFAFAEEEPEKFEEFIIGFDDNGEEISYTSNPDTLENYLGANPDVPKYLTPIHFKKSVLAKYHNEPSKYSVVDSYLRCGSLWGISIDNHHKDKIIVWLGDLGRDLPHAEQLYLKAHNIPPVGKVSNTFFQRQIMAEATDSTQPEHLFRQHYDTLQKACEQHLGWQLLLPLKHGDRYHLQCIRVPATNEQSDFDTSIMGLVKVLIDSLNEKQLKQLIPSEKRAKQKGISLLNSIFVTRSVSRAEKHITFMRKLQGIRSSGIAHRKGAKYQGYAAYFGIGTKNLSSVFRDILSRAVELLKFFNRVVTSGALNGSND